eukprot:2474153-Pyramimonas_sp.AAC.1
MKTVEHSSSLPPSVLWRLICKVAVYGSPSATSPFVKIWSMAPRVEPLLSSQDADSRVSLLGV